MIMNVDIPIIVIIPIVAIILIIIINNILIILIDLHLNPNLRTRIGSLYLNLFHSHTIIIRGLGL